MRLAPPVTGRGREAGFTIPEVLVSLAILASVLWLATAGLQQVVGFLSRGGDAPSLDRVRVRWLVAEALEGVFDYYVAPAGGPETRPCVPYFEGDGTGFTFVTLNAVSAPGVPAWARLWYDARRGSLVYGERPMERWFLRSAGDRPEPAYEVPVFEGIRGVEFSYEGIRSTREVFTGDDVRFEAVRGEGRDWDGARYLRLPERIRIRVRGEAGEWEWTVPVRGSNYRKREFFCGE
ncbi:PulJ/GspJ family protein [Deferrisoma palaeochoriense]